MDFLLAELTDLLGGRSLIAAGMFDTFGVSPVKLLLQLAIVFIPAILATRHVVARRAGGDLVAWLFLVWGLPWVGPAVALLCVRKPATREG